MLDLVPATYFPVARYVKQADVVLPKSANVADARIVEPQQPKKGKSLFGSSLPQKIEEFLLKIVHVATTPPKPPTSNWTSFVEFSSLRESLNDDDKNLMAKWPFPDDQKIGRKKQDEELQKARAKDLGIWLTQFLFLCRQQECSSVGLSQMGFGS